MEAITEETAGFRQATQIYLAENRAEMESLIHESTDRLMEQTRVPAQEAHSWETRTVELQTEFMVSYFSKFRFPLGYFYLSTDLERGNFKFGRFL